VADTACTICCHIGSLAHRQATPRHFTWHHGQSCTKENKLAWEALGSSHKTQPGCRLRWHSHPYLPATLPQVLERMGAPGQLMGPLPSPLQTKPAGQLLHLQDEQAGPGGRGVRQAGGAGLVGCGLPGALVLHVPAGRQLLSIARLLRKLHSTACKIIGNGRTVLPRHSLGGQLEGGVAGGAGAAAGAATLGGEGAGAAASAAAGRGQHTCTG